MKTITFVMITLVTLNVTAQNKRERHSKKTDNKEALLADLTPEEVTDLKVKRMTLQLDLTESQQQEVKAVVLKETTFKQEQREKREQKGKPEATKKPSKEERVERMNANLDRKIAIKKDMKSILNPEQYEKWELHQEQQHKKRRKGKRKERE